MNTGRGAPAHYPQITGRRDTLAEDNNDFGEYSRALCVESKALGKQRPKMGKVIIVSEGENILFLSSCIVEVESMRPPQRSQWLWREVLSHVVGGAWSIFRDSVSSRINSGSQLGRSFSLKRSL